MRKIAIAILSLGLFACGTKKKPETTTEEIEATANVAVESSIINEGENHFASLKQLTNGGDNAEAYWSFDDSKLVFQVSNPEWELECDQIFVFDWQKENLMEKVPQMVSTGLGRTTCSYFLPGDTTLVYASTHLADSACPPTPERTNGSYVWPIYESFDIFTADLQGNITNQLTTEPGYDAEATVSPKGDKIVFTSIRTGDLELFTCDIDGSNVTQITFDLGYDGGAFFSPDGTQLIFRSSRPKTVGEIAKYKSLLDRGLVEPTNMELYICNADGSKLTQLTDLGKANWCPFFHPSGNKIIFASNYSTERGYPFNLYMINTDGTGLEQVTHDDTFDAFPVFSNDGKHLVFSSNRNNGGTRETNLFVAEWQD
ncbi:MAG: TolB protein [Vicingaceae bacterium]|jgi:TolB protein